jgi:hypothetical protein
MIPVLFIEASIFDLSLKFFSLRRGSKVDCRSKEVIRLMH